VAVARLSAFQEAHPGLTCASPSTGLVDFKSGDVDAAIRYGRGHWPGLRADWLMADELFPVCSLPCWRAKNRCGAGRLADHVLLHSSAANDDDWRLCSPPPVCRPTSRSNRHHLRSGVHDVQARSTESRGHGRTSYVEADIAKGRLVVPFKIALPADAASICLTRGEGRYAQAVGISAVAKGLDSWQTRKAS